MAGRKTVVNYSLTVTGAGLKPEVPALKKKVEAPVEGIHECKFYGEFGCCRHPRMCGKAEVHTRVGGSHMTGCVWRPSARGRCVNYQPLANKAAAGFANVLILDPNHGSLAGYFSLGQTEGGKSIAAIMINEYNAWKKEREDGAQKKLCTG